MDTSGEFHFLEMNTRIQVEHPVTEATTSIDIVKQMIRIAAGEPLGISQDSIALRGCALEARIYAEDAERGFLPSPGRIDVFRPPAGAGIRVDSGVQAGDVVTPHYDAMLAKLVAWGHDRAEALARLDGALSEFAVAGIQTSIPFHRRILRHPAFAAGVYDTGFVADCMAGGKLPLTAAVVASRPLAIALFAIASIPGDLPRSAIVEQKGSAGGVFPVVVSGASGSAPGEDGVSGEYLAEVAGETLRVDVSQGQAGSFSLIVAGRQIEALVAEIRPGRFAVDLADSRFILSTRGGK
jgi:hypothetical protein